MSPWIEPLQLETWIVNVFAGSLEIFLAVGLIFVFGLAAFFRMTSLTLVLLLGLFLVMFSGWINIELYFLIIALASVLVGFWISRIVKG